jgi:hypothetical protein
MPLLNIDLSQAPDVQPIISPGIKRMLIKEPPVLKPAKSGTGSVLNVELYVQQDGTEDHGRRAMDWISTTMETRIKRLALSAGIPREEVEDKNGFDTDKLAGRVVLAVIGTRTYKDPSTNIDREVNSVQDYLIPGDQGYDSTPAETPAPATTGA